RRAPRIPIHFATTLAVAVMGCNTCGDLEERHPFDETADAGEQVDATTVDADVSDAASPDSGAPSPGGIWIDRDVVRSLPTSGPAWEGVLTFANRLPGTADISDQDSSHDVETMAAALVCVRL